MRTPPTTIVGKVVRIFDEYRLVLNRGSEHGVQRGDKFYVYSETEEILDPDSGASLGSYRNRKATVIADEVHPQFTVASTPSRREQVEERPAGGTLGLIYGATTKRSYREVQDTLPVEDHDIKPIPSQDTVRVGDVVELSPSSRPKTS
ncbi:hypothetical protein OJ997_31725 [Solirubrobacter phytolaccae]|uniref:Flagellar assembly protein T C-terminal domain-containing protein n=1 Tax=Solirubrobacter phytolaccae TaxID=1404360 RepID=A0A9X3NJY3_9ACTN|nr:FlgT C-terminal domain-containing protein [Solirubrobacter phytolaccae]MDA0184916.1 hypothetical protein [Solirubrobacter phytolaccae]